MLHRETSRVQNIDLKHDVLKCSHEDNSTECMAQWEVLLFSCLVRSNYSSPQDEGFEVPSWK